MQFYYYLSFNPDTGGLRSLLVLWWTCRWTSLMDKLQTFNSDLTMRVQKVDKGVSGSGTWNRWVSQCDKVLLEECLLVWSLGDDVRPPYLAPSRLHILILQVQLRRVSVPAQRFGVWPKYKHNFRRGSGPIRIRLGVPWPAISPSPAGLSGLDRLEVNPREQPLSGLGLSWRPPAVAEHASFTWNSLTGSRSRSLWSADNMFQKQTTVNSKLINMNFIF